MKTPKTTRPVTVNLLTPKAASQFSARPFQAPEDQQREEKNENKTGLPDSLKAGIENLSGMSLDDVKVFYNSSKPAQLQAYAFTRGTNAIQNKNMNRRINTYSPQENNPVVQLGRKGDKKGKNPSKKTAESREAGRAARFASRNPEKAKKPTVFGNEEGRLPKAGKGQHYIETDVGAGRNDRGRKRILSLVDSNSGRVLKQYNTDDHYETFS